MIALSQCPGITATDATAALQAALNLGQPITADCPVTCVMGSDPTKSVFVPNGSDVTFTPRGRFDVDNAGFPAFAFMNSAATWRGTQIRYVGTPSLIAPHAANAWNDGPAKAYLAKQGAGAIYWTGPSNTCAVISIRGNSNVNLQGGRIYVDDDVTADRFPTTAVDLGPGYAPGSATLALPWFTSSDFELDGSVMGYVGSAAAVNLTRIRRGRYADLQDAAGGTVGGVGCWLSPPHWIYFNDSAAAPMGVIKIKDAYDRADYRGAQLRRPTSSGYINVMKMPLVNGSSVDGFVSLCVDGGIGLLSNGLSNVGGTVRNCYVRTDSSLLSVDGKYSSTGGLFFPSSAKYPASDIEISVDDVSARLYPIANVPPGVSLRSVVRVGVGS